MKRGGLIRLQAFRTNAKKIQAVRSNDTGDRRIDPIVQVLQWLDLKVADRSAPFTDKVIVLVDEGIVSASSLTEIELLDPLLSSQDVQIAINRSKRDSRHLNTNLLVNPLRRRM